MKARGIFTRQEITTQGASWRGALDAVRDRRAELVPLLERNRSRPTIFMGCGSTHYLALHAAAHFQRVTGRPARGVPSSELWLQADTVSCRGELPMVVAVSRSGETTETLRAAQAMAARGCDVLTISCYDQAPLARMSALTVAIAEGREESYAQTRSFAGMLVAAQAVAALAAGDQALLADLERLPGLAADLIARASDMARRWGPDEGTKRITFLGSGPLYGLACEATVKMKEMSLSLAEAYHFMEFRHGPMALVDGEHLIVGLLSESVRSYEVAVLRDLKARGARVLAIANEGGAEYGPQELAPEFDALMPLRGDVCEAARGVLYMPFLQLLAYERAIARGLDPDRPRHVVMAIRLDEAETGA